MRKAKWDESLPYNSGHMSSCCSFLFCDSVCVILQVCIPVELFSLQSLNIYTPMAFFIPVGIRLTCTIYLYKGGCVMVYYMLLFCMGANNNLYLHDRR